MSFHAEPKVSSSGNSFKIYNDSPHKKSRRARSRSPSREPKKKGYQKRNSSPIPERKFSKKKNGYYRPVSSRKGTVRAAPQQRQHQIHRRQPTAYAQRNLNPKDNIILHPVKNTGKVQVRNIQLRIEGNIEVFEGGKIMFDDPEAGETEETHYVRIHFRNEQQLRDGIQEALDDFMEMISVLDGDSQNKLFCPEQRHAEDGISKEELYEVARAPKDILMYSVSPIDNRRLTGKKGGAKRNEVPVLENCVVEYLYKNYKEKIPTLTRDKIRELLLGKDYNPKKKYDSNLRERGWTVGDVDNFCRHYKIPHYALDDRNWLIFKSRAENTACNHPMLCYFCADGHMYPITEKGVRISITRRFANRSGDDGEDGATNIVHRSVGKDDEQRRLQAEKAEAAMFKLPYHEDIPLHRLSEYSDCVIYYHKLCLKKMVIELFRNSGDAKVLYEFKSSRKQVTHIKFDNNVHLMANANHKSGCDWEDSTKVAKSLSLVYRNQSIAKLTQQYFEQHYHPAGSKGKSKREHIPDKVRLRVLQRQKFKCNMCPLQLSVEKKRAWECDHIRTLANGGHPTAVFNLQILCRPCHDQKCRLEAAERMMNIDNSLSYYNSKGAEIFANGTFLTKQTVHTFLPKEAADGKIVAGLDVNKCYTNILKYGNTEEFNCYSVLDYAVPFDNKIHGKIPRGFYFVESEGIQLPLKGNTWCCAPLVKYCLEHKIITKSQIKYAFLSSLSLPSHYFSPFIQAVQKKIEAGEKNKFKAAKMWKLMFNSFIGLLGIRTTKFSDFTLMQRKDAAAYYIYRKQNPNQQVNMYPRRFDGNNQKAVENAEYYEVVMNTEKIREESHYPIFSQILQEGWIELHKMQLLLEKHGGKLMHVNTDCALALFDTQKQVDAMWKECSEITWDEGGKVPKYKLMGKEALRENLLDRREEPCTAKFHAAKPEYNITEDPGHNDFRKFAKEIIKKNESCQLQSLAGTGKTTLARECIYEIKRKEQSCLILAPTHKAAKVLHPEAQTIDKALGSLKFGSGFHSFEKYDWIIIDEKSMIKETFFMLLYKIKKACPGVKFLLSGDWKQLPPVLDRSDFDYENSFCVWDLCDGNMISLTKCRRSDRKLFKLYTRKDLHKLDVSQFPHAECDLNITFKNSTRKRLNEYWMRKYTRGMPGTMKLKADPHIKQSQDVILFPGMKCMASTTRMSFEFCNCDEFIVESYNEKEVTLIRQDEDNLAEKLKPKVAERKNGRPSKKAADQEANWDAMFKVVIPTNKFCSWFQPSYAITCHRMQGSSVDRPFSIWDWESMCPRLKYVALSRSRKYKYINICGMAHVKKSELKQAELDRFNSDSETDSETEMDNSDSDCEVQQKETKVEKAFKSFRN
jgi:5-methylcytosine-specific restriction endonuclease McrA